MNRENSRKFKVAIVGGGASGLALSIMLAKKFKKGSVVLFERLDRVGKKLLQTGNGQCNLGNVDGKLHHFHGKNEEFANYVITTYSSQIETFFNWLGIPLAEDNGKIYPLSKQASSVVDALRFKAENLGVEIRLNSKISSVKNCENSFTITTEEGLGTIAENLVICAGGKSQKHLGTDGSGYFLLQSLGHSLTSLYPSIVQLKTETAKIKGLKGLKQKVKAKAIVGGKVLAETSGDILFTDYGVSGNACFYLSSYLTGESDGYLNIDFCPELTFEGLKTQIENKQRECSYLSGEYILLGIMNNKIGSSVLRNSGFKDLGAPISSFSADKISKAVKDYSIKVVGTMGFDGAQVTKGGIDTGDFNEKTLESKLVKGLYACGEILDVDGDCGGYNLTWAFASAMAVSESIK